MKERVVGDADPYGGWETARVPQMCIRDRHNSENSYELTIRSS